MDRFRRNVSVLLVLITGIRRAYIFSERADKRGGGGLLTPKSFTQIRSLRLWREKPGYYRGMSLMG
jgi:hypothetical protein